jgi:hypothetical protein
VTGDVFSGHRRPSPALNISKQLMDEALSILEDSLTEFDLRFEVNYSASS